MTRDDASFLVVTRGIASQLENFCCEVLQDGGEIDRGTCWQALDIWNAQSPLSRETYQHQHAERSSLSSTDGGHDRREMRDQPWTNGYKSTVSYKCIDHQCCARPRDPNKSQNGRIRKSTRQNENNGKGSDKTYDCAFLLPLALPPDLPPVILNWMGFAMEDGYRKD